MIKAEDNISRLVIIIIEISSYIHIEKTENMLMITYTKTENR